MSVYSGGLAQEELSGLNNAGLPGNAPKGNPPTPDDIPIALRETPDVIAKPKSNLGWIVAGGMVSAIALGAGAILLLRPPVISRSPAANSNTTVTASPQASPTPASDGTLLNHYPYTEAPVGELQAINADGSLKLRRAAAQAFKEMSAAAQRDGISLVPISGFRSVADQKHLYFDVKEERNQVATERAKVSAPPGYSEHHTGYAVDIGDGATPATNLSQSFEQTAAFQWLEANAARYSFEISFPQGNPQGVMYEPWHWRFVGDSPSLETFYKAKSKVNQSQ